MATLEAWWAERPVLVNARCDVLRGQCKRANAGLYYASQEEFLAALALLEGDPALRARLGRSGRTYFEAHYSWQVIEGKYLALLAPIVAADSRRTA
jgi:glycosyltransferase involved in cell wall biosynthesis